MADGKVLGSWSGMRKYLEQDMLAEALKGRVRYGCTRFVGMDGCHIFEICVDGKQVKRFSWETVNSYFIAQKDKPGSIQNYWAGFWKLMEQYPLEARTEYPVPLVPPSGTTWEPPPTAPAPRRIAEAP